MRGTKRLIDIIVAPLATVGNGNRHHSLIIFKSENHLKQEHTQQSLNLSENWLLAACSTKLRRIQENLLKLSHPQGKIIYIKWGKYRASTQIPLGSCSDSIYARFQGN